MKITVLLEFLQKPKVNWYYKVAVHRNHPCMGGMGGRGGGGDYISVSLLSCFLLCPSKSS